jgi:hypothetical protein
MKYTTMGMAVTCLLAGSLATTDVQGQCMAPKAWFPHAKTPEPDFHSPKDNCEFHQWAWQTFLWLTQSTGPGRIRLLDLPTASDLFMAGRAPPRLTAALLSRLKKQPLDLRPRVIKSAGPTTFEDIHQAGSRGVLVDRNGRAVYYASHVSPTFYEFVRSRKLYIKQNYIKAKPTDTFPVKSLELKTSWRIVLKGEKTTGLFTTTARIHPLVCRNGKDNCTGDDITSANKILTYQDAAAYCTSGCRK